MLFIPSLEGFDWDVSKVEDFLVLFHPQSMFADASCINQQLQKENRTFVKIDYVDAADDDEKCVLARITFTSPYAS